MTSFTIYKPQTVVPPGHVYIKQGHTVFDVQVKNGIYRYKNIYIFGASLHMQSNTAHALHDYSMARALVTFLQSQGY